MFHGILRCNHNLVSTLIYLNMLNNIATSAYTKKPDIYLIRAVAYEQIATQTFGDARSDGT